MRPSRGKCTIPFNRMTGVATASDPSRQTCRASGTRDMVGRGIRDKKRGGVSPASMAFMTGNSAGNDESIYGVGIVIAAPELSNV